MSRMNSGAFVVLVSNKSSKSKHTIATCLYPMEMPVYESGNFARIMAQARNIIELWKSFDDVEVAMAGRKVTK